AEMIEDRTDDWRQDRKRHHRDQQIQRHLPASLADLRVEEHGGGEPHGHERVAGAGGGMQIQQADHANFAGSTLITQKEDIPDGPPSGTGAAARRDASPLDRRVDRPTRRRTPLVVYLRHVHILTYQRDPRHISALADTTKVTGTTGVAGSSRVTGG